MRTRLLWVCAVALAFTGILQSEDTWTGVSRIVAVGDVHGDLVEFSRVLRMAGVIDQDGNWCGAKTHLVQTGDLLDRGSDSRAVMDLMMKLEKQSAAAGGAVHSLTGNHEAMNVYGDLRYVSAPDFAKYATDKSKSDGTHPLGYAEQRAAFGPDGVYGKWIRGHNAIIRVNDMVFMHAGVSPKFAKWSMKKINDEVRGELNDFSRLPGILKDTDSPLWYRGLVADDEKSLDGHLKNVLQRLGAKYMVVGHTVTNGGKGGPITPRFDGRLIMIDVGLSAIYGAHTACLLVEDGKQFALDHGKKVPLPAGAGDMPRYMSELAAAETAPQP